jgi:hypothetical protein
MAVIPRRSLPVSWRIQVSVPEGGEMEALQTDATSSVALSHRAKCLGSSKKSEFGSHQGLAWAAPGCFPHQPSNFDRNKKDNYTDHRREHRDLDAVWAPPEQFPRKQA